MNDDLDRIAAEPKTGGARFVQDIRGVRIKKRGSDTFRPAFEVFAEERAKRDSAKRTD